MTKHETWSTLWEKRFIDYLIDPPVYVKVKKPVVERLEGYIKHAKQRIEWNTWGEVDGYAVLAYAENLLSEALDENTAAVC